MRACWKHVGETGEGMPERGLESIAQAFTGLDLEEFFERYVRGTGELPLHRLLKAFGIRMHLRPAESVEDAGGKPASPDTTPPTRTEERRVGKEWVRTCSARCWP